MISVYFPRYVSFQRDEVGATKEYDGIILWCKENGVGIKHLHRISIRPKNGDHRSDRVAWKALIDPDKELLFKLRWGQISLSNF